MSDTTEKKEEVGYYAIIPATVRYDKSLSANSKLLYGEITALCKKEGYCWASNSYFAELYDVQRSSISNWVKALADAGHITVEYVLADGKPNIERRKIFLAHVPLVCPQKKSIRQKTNKQDEGGQIIDQGGGQKNEQGGQKNRKRIIQAINTKAAAAAYNPDQTFEEPEKPPEKAAATAIFDEEELNKLQIHFKQLNPKLLFDEDFYPKVLAYLNYHEAGLNFVSWLYEACAKKNPRNIVNYFYTVFFEKRYVEMYREVTKPPPVILIRCPVCNTEHVKNETCPECGIEKDNIHNQAEVFRRKRLYTMTAAEKKAFEAESEAILSGTWDIQKSRDLDSLHRRYGLVQDG